MSLLGPLFRWDALEAVFCDRARVQAMLDFEAALARAEARAGILPSSSAAAIASRCRADLVDLDALARTAARAGNLAIPLVAQLTALVEKEDPEAARYVHWGSTSQDAIDTGLMLQLRAALDLVDGELLRLADALAVHVRAHRGTPLAGRTWMQHAVPTSFGFKAASWLDAVHRHRARVAELRGRALALQLGGAVGTLAALGERGLDVAEAVAEYLKLPLPVLPWHSHRDRIADFAATLAVCAGTLGKIARDVALHAQTEIGELLEPRAAGRGGSTSMPHKQNPVASAVVLAASVRIPGLAASIITAMVQEDERGLGGWQAEWELVPELVGLFGGALHGLTDLVAGLRVDPERMAQNLLATRGLVFAEAVEMALASRTGRGDARKLVEAACRRAESEGRELRDVLAADPQVGQLLSAEALEPLFDPARQLGAAPTLIDRVLALHDAARAKTRA